MRLVVDFNSYFASVEQQLDPALRGRPVAVVPMLADTTCCIAASYQAKAFGVKTGTRVAEARRLCPELVLVTGQHARYVEFHQRLTAAIDRVLQVVAVTSIDEMHCDLNTRDANPESARRIALAIKDAIRSDVGECLTCSIGIAPNAFLAKTASDMQKPDGLVMLWPEDLPYALYGLELRDLCGIGARMEQRLRRHGIHTVRQLCEASRETLHQAWGSTGGDLMWARLRGEEPYVPQSTRKSISHSHVLAPEMRNDRDAHATLHRMLQKAAMRLRKEGLVAGSLHVRIQYVDRQHWGQDGRLNATEDSLILAQGVDALWTQRPRTRVKPLAVGVVLLDLAPASQATLPLFDESRPKIRLHQALDRINLRYGKNAVFYGSAFSAREHAPMRIAFTRIPDLDTER